MHTHVIANTSVVALGKEHNLVRRALIFLGARNTRSQHTQPNGHADDQADLHPSFVLDILASRALQPLTGCVSVISTVPQDALSSSEMHVLKEKHRNLQRRRGSQPQGALTGRAQLANDQDLYITSTARGHGGTGHASAT